MVSKYQHIGPSENTGHDDTIKDTLTRWKLGVYALGIIYALTIAVSLIGFLFKPGTDPATDRRLPTDAIYGHSGQSPP